MILSKSKFLKSSYWSVCFFLMIAVIACEKNDDHERDIINETNEDLVVFVVGEQGEKDSVTVEFRDSGKKDFILSLSKSANDAISASLVYDESILKSFNEANETSYTLFPEDMVSISGAVTIKSGEKNSGNVTVNYESNSELSADKSYVIPLTIRLSSDKVKLAEEGTDFLLFVKDLDALSNAEKENGLKVISFFEVNDTNPLNALCFILEESKKPLIDMVVLFSSNINYNSETERVYVHHNENVTHLLENRNKYIKPLQDRGIKVLLSILGNHDRSGISNLSDETARQFAQEIKNEVNTYKLDGVFFDDEYSKYEYSSPPEGFVVPSSQAAARLVYETKLAIPDKVVSTYVYSGTHSLPGVDGKESGEFVDLGIHDYLRGDDLSDNYPGMQKSGMILYSQEFNRNYFANQSQIQEIVDKGYGGTMIFAVDPNRGNLSRQKEALDIIADSFFDETLIYNKQPYPKDW